MNTTILVPTYNERDTVADIIRDIFSTLPSARVLVIDDSSPDGTAAVVEGLRARYPNLSLLKRAGKEGLGAAYKHAIRHVLAEENTDRIVTMDADGSHDPAYLPEMLTLAGTHDVVVGSRYVRGGGIEKWEPWRHALSKYGNLYARALTGVPVRDLTAGFVCVNRNLAERLQLEMIGSSGYAYQIEFKAHCHRSGARIAEMPIIFKNRRGGESKMSGHIIREGLITPLKLFFNRVQRRLHGMS